MRAFPDTTKTVSHWIGGKTVEGASGTYGPVTDLATGAVTTQVAFATVDAVVAAAKEAYATWGSPRSPGGPRSFVLKPSEKDPSASMKVDRGVAPMRARSQFCPSMPLPLER
ncbi:hypothetical protein ACFPH6_42135 [Streptomyces xiangluensis]|uniref:Malonate-semialdehyde dehydrogenase (Acetylating) / methylmalonate-semialdehyde dehydrogenase n=1 Tax=Streptomyces xiangluensis TaxID=2665720 RepID=A0ABV8Z490_9ACTN